MLNHVVRCLVVQALSKARESETGRAGRVRCFNGETVYTAQHDQNKTEYSDDPVENTCDTETHPITVFMFFISRLQHSGAHCHVWLKKISSHYQSIFATVMLANVFFMLGIWKCYPCWRHLFPLSHKQGASSSLFCRFFVALSVAHTNVCVCFSHVRRLLRQCLGQVLVLFRSASGTFSSFLGDLHRQG